MQNDLDDKEQKIVKENRVILRHVITSIFPGPLCTYDHHFETCGFDTITITISPQWKIVGEILADETSPGTYKKVLKIRIVIEGILNELYPGHAKFHRLKEHRSTDAMDELRDLFKKIKDFLISLNPEHLPRTILSTQND